jgi:DNA-binding LytR/AlgR family response regulator
MRIIDDIENPLLEICTSFGFQLIPISNIVFIKSNGKGSDIILRNNEIINVRNLLCHFDSLLPADVFFRCHHSFLINFLYIKSYKLNEARFINGMTTRISRTKYKIFRERYIEIMKYKKPES